MSRTYDTEQELTALFTVLEGEPEVSAQMYSKLDADDFGYPRFKEIWETLEHQKSLNPDRLIRSRDLKAAPGLSDKAKEFLKKPRKPVTLAGVDVVYEALEKLRIIRQMQPLLLSAVNELSKATGTVDIDHVRRMLVRATDKTDDTKGGLFPLINLEDVQEKKVRFVWRGVPRGVVTMLDGKQGLGKTLLTCHIAAEISNRKKRNRVMVLDCENNLGSSLKPRFMGAGARLQKIKIVDLKKLDVSLPKDFRNLEHTIREGKFTLVIIDPIFSFLSGVETNSDDGARSIMRPLHAIAENTNCAILLVRHVGKNQRAADLDAGMGSTAWNASCRSGYKISRPDKYNPEKLLLTNYKHNDYRKLPDLPFEIKGTETRPNLEFHEPDIHPLQGLGEDSESQNDKKYRLAVDFAKEHPHSTWKKIITKVDGDFSRETFQRARKLLKKQGIIKKEEAGDEEGAD